MNLQDSLHSVIFHTYISKSSYSSLKSISLERKRISKNYMHNYIVICFEKGEVKVFPLNAWCYMLPSFYENTSLMILLLCCSLSQERVKSSTEAVIIIEGKYNMPMSLQCFKLLCIE